MTPSWSHVLHIDVQVMLDMVQLGTFWLHLHTVVPNGDATWGTLMNTMPENKWQTPVKTCVLKISDWAVVPPILKQCGPQLGLKLLPNRSNLGPSYAMLGPSWAEVEIRVQFGPRLEPFWPKAYAAAMSGRSGEFGRWCADMQNVLSSTAGNLFLMTWPGTWPRVSWSCASRTGCPSESIGSAPKPSRLGTLGAGRFLKHAVSFWYATCAGARRYKASIVDSCALPMHLV